MFSETIIAAASCLSVLFVGPAMVASTAVMAPVLDPARRLNGKVRVALIDVCCLVVLVQLALALVARGQAAERGEFPLLLPMLLAVLLGVGWWRGVRALSRLGIVQSLRRAVFLLYVVPVAFLWIIALFVVLLSSTPLFGDDRFTNSTPRFVLAWALAGAGLKIGIVVFFLWTAYRASRWVVRGAQPWQGQRVPSRLGDDNAQVLPFRGRDG